MPNHVHVLARPYSDADYPLEKLVQGWKGFSANAIGKILAEAPRPFWQDEYFDRIVRDEEHLWRSLQYIGSNAQRANLVVESCPRYVCESWRAAGWVFQD